MIPTQFAKYIRYKTKTNSTTFPDDDILTIANIIKDDIAKEILKANEDYFGMKALRNLVAGQRGYAFPSDMLSQIKYLQVTLDGVKQQEIEQFDVTSYKRPTDENDIQKHWQGKKPEFDVYGGSLYIYSDSAIIDVTNGLELWYTVYPQDLANLTDTTDMSVPYNTISFGMPRQFHKVWATMVIADWKNSKEKPLPLSDSEAKADVDLQLAVNSLKGLDLNRSIVATVSDHSHNGQDY